MSATLIRNGIVLPMSGRAVAIDPGSVLLDGTEIVAVGPVPAIDADPRAAGADVVDASRHAVIPGLHNCHLHSGLLRSAAESLSLWDWLEAYVDPAHRALTPEIAATASRHCYAESVLAGTTWVGLEHLFYCTPEAFRAAVDLAGEIATGLHTHSSESIWEVQESLKRYGLRPIEEMYNRGVLSEHTVIAHCPCSNMKLSSGAARVGAMRAAGVTVGLGSDGEKENNNLDLLEEMKFASLLKKVTTLDPTTGDPWDVLAMATIAGARALGLASVTGSLEAGKRADVVTVELGGLHTTPVLHGQDFNVAAHLVFSSSGHDVRDVWVDGRRLVAGGRPLTFDAEATRAESQAAAEELFARRAALAGP